MGKYSSKHNDPYCYPGTEVLINKKNIRDQSKLDTFERIYSAKRLLELAQKPIKGNFDLKHLQKIHHYIFQDIYEFAGEIRTVNIGKGIQFCPVLNIEDYFQSAVSEKINILNDLKGLNRDEFSKICAGLFAEVNIVHPFREGNGRAQREFFRCLAVKNGFNFKTKLSLCRKLTKSPTVKPLFEGKSTLEVVSTLIKRDVTLCTECQKAHLNKVYSWNVP